MLRYTSRVSAVPLALTATLAGLNGLAMEHRGLSPEDQFVQCARGVFGKPLLLDESSPWPDANVACPTPRQALIGALKAKSILTFETDDWVFLTHQSWFDATRPLSHAEWKQLKVTQSVKEWGLSDSRSLPPTEQQRVAKVIMEHARPPIASTPRGRDSSGRVNDTIHLVLYVDAHVFGKQDKESVVAVYGQEHRARRLVYGDIAGGVYRAVWDSPIVPGDWLSMGYRDLDGDGTAEILLQSKMGTSGRSLGLVVFNLRGREISRQEGKNCEWLRYATRPDVSCPIGGEYEAGVDYEVGEDGKTDIVVQQAGSSVRFRLVNGRYVRKEGKPAGKR